MSRFQSHINTVNKILGIYRGDVPLSVFLKKFFAADKKYGSRDRKTISHYAYVFFRVSGLMPNASPDEVIRAGIFLTGNTPHEELPFAWNEHIGDSLSAKLSMLGFGAENFFPFRDRLSAYIDSVAFGLSLLIQPSLFLRLRTGREEHVAGNLEKTGISFARIRPDTLELLPGTGLKDIPGQEKDFVVQDLSSQQVMDDLPDLFNGQAMLKVWDCCAGSGGKSILLYDRFKGKVSITATDVRESILVNFRKRMSAAGIPVVFSKAADVSAGEIPPGNFKLIVCDVPCSGSGTWSRTPEQIFFFSDSLLNDYVKKQEQIVLHSLAALEPGGYYLYITCSVFERENEGMTEFISKEGGLELIRSGYIEGYQKKADTMYVALFQSQPIA